MRRLAPRARFSPNNRPPPPGPGERASRRALRSVGHDGGELLRADQRADPDACEETAAFAAEFYRRPADRQRLGLGSKGIDVGEGQLALDSNHRPPAVEGSLRSLGR